MVSVATILLLCLIFEEAFVSEGKNVENTASIIDTCRIRESDDKLVCLPDIMFIGASKAGTSSIAAYLFQHPRIENAKVMNPKTNPRQSQFHNLSDPYDMPSVHRKEAHYWDGSNPKGIGILKSIYDNQPGFSLNFNESRPLLMDYTPNYLLMESAATLIKQKMPNANKLKFIVVLRNPTERAISSWVYKKSCRSCEATSPRMPSFEVSVNQGINQGNCISKCFQKQVKRYPQTELMSNFTLKIFTADDDKGCSISRCRMKYDHTGGKTGGSPFMV